MKIMITNQAQDQLNHLNLTDGLLPRIDAELTGGCGLAISYVFIFDQQRKLDTIYRPHGIPIRMDYVTQKYLNHTGVTIDYNEADGFYVMTKLTFDRNPCG
ncbi:iron-sulfur cluster biosynthesis family protein [Amphibacillus jilinensis]|uniref:iron-sulfur cluster biosynthesis family protein n=1 Tax=Amphibacillus jilinensis TaxID=1216008 RepID=UPI0002D617DA|nr:iron-sulfur cluster biosynthesis family protein [Amphibacillus jilinensis]